MRAHPSLAQRSIIPGSLEGLQVKPGVHTGAARSGVGDEEVVQERGKEVLELGEGLGRPGDGRLVRVDLGFHGEHDLGELGELGGSVEAGDVEEGGERPDGGPDGVLAGVVLLLSRS